MMSEFSITGLLTDIFKQKIYPARVRVSDGKIQSISEILNLPPDSVSKPSAGLSEETSNYILPGFIDSHVHIESSMLIPAEFAKLAVVHGTVATVSDPHEIANVCGISGVEFMIENGRTVPFKFYFGAPSCVPATPFETAGAFLNAENVKTLLQRDEIKYLSEMMNFPGVLNHDSEVMEKIAAAHRLGKPVDGHAPGLKGENAKKYIDAGISTDHECFTKEEAVDKLKYGMKIIIREGSAAKNFEALIDLLNEHSEHMMFCSDDKHPDSLVTGHINQLCSRAISKGIDVFKVLRAACVNPVVHYNLDVGLLREGDPADLVLVKDLKSFEVIQTYINGELVANRGKSGVGSRESGVGSRESGVGSRESGVGGQSVNINNFNCSKKSPEDFEVKVKDFPFRGHEGIGVAVIEALDGQLITNKLFLEPKIESGKLISDVERDILKIVVVNRYYDSPIAKGFIKNFGLKEGAIASSVAHDSHNIIAVGADDESLCEAVNLIIEHTGGVSCVGDDVQMVLPLPVAGLMSNEDGYKVAKLYTEIDAVAKNLGCALSAPFMTLSFMALLVIPHLKLSDKGLFDGDSFSFV